MALNIGTSIGGVRVVRDVVPIPVGRRHPASCSHGTSRPRTPTPSVGVAGGVHRCFPSDGRHRLHYGRWGGAAIHRPRCFRYTHRSLRRTQLQLAGRDLRRRTTRREGSPAGWPVRWTIPRQFPQREGCGLVGGEPSAALRRQGMRRRYEVAQRCRNAPTANFTV